MNYNCARARTHTWIRKAVIWKEKRTYLFLYFWDGVSLKYCHARELSVSSAQASFSPWYSWNLIFFLCEAQQRIIPAKPSREIRTSVSFIRSGVRIKLRRSLSIVGIPFFTMHSYARKRENQRYEHSNER